MTKDLAIPMSDGVKLRGDLTLPANADGTPIGAKVPVIVTITAYNKTVIAGGFGGDARRRRPGVPRQARLRPAHRRRPRHRLVARASGTPSTSARTRTRPRSMTWAHTAARGATATPR